MSTKLPIQKKFLCSMSFDAYSPKFHHRIILGYNEKDAASYYANLPYVKTHPEACISVKEIA